MSSPTQLSRTPDKPFTEKMDYFSAAATILCGLFYTVVRLFHLYTPPTSSLTFRKRPCHPLLIPWALLCSLLFVAHVTYLSLLPRFDYSYNIIAHVIIGLSHNLLWASYSLPSPFFYKRFPSLPNSYQPKCVRTPVLLAVAMTSASALEIFDFSPWWRIIDAHSLWHLSTVPLIFWWYRFLIEDARDPGWRMGKEQVLMS